MDASKFSSNGESVKNEIENEQTTNDNQIQNCDENFNQNQNAADYHQNDNYNDDDENNEGIFINDNYDESTIDKDKNYNSENNYNNDDDEVENNEQSQTKNKDFNLNNNDVLHKQDFDFDDRECLNEENSDDEEMSDEMILIEEEKIEFHLNLRHLSNYSLSNTGNKTPNYQTIVDALRFNSLPDPKYTKLLNSLIETLSEFKDERIMLLLSSKSQKFNGIYILANDGNTAEKLLGNGPNCVNNDDVSKIYKYLI